MKPSASDMVALLRRAQFEAAMDARERVINLRIGRRPRHGFERRVR